MSSTRVRLRIASVLLLAAVWFGVEGCLGMTPQNGWSKQWGPMVPHHTFPGDCGICHQPDGWQVLRDDFEFHHAEETGYALEGAHVRASCLRCHNDRGPVESYVQRGCAGCHIDIHRGSNGQTCKDCHDQNQWRPVGLVADHANTRFPLYGKHAFVPCDSCHQGASGGIYRGVSTDCHQCHLDDALAVINPNHSDMGWLTNCDSCHNSGDWDAVGFHQDFPLVGGHQGVDCLDCHPGGNFGPVSPLCYDCHSLDYINAPNHVALNYPTDCTLCHSVYGF